MAVTKTEAESIDGLPPSAKLVYKVLEYECPLSQTVLVEETYLVERTVRYACDRLEDRGLTESWNDPNDQRWTIYHTTSGERHNES